MTGCEEQGAELVPGNEDILVTPEDVATSQDVQAMDALNQDALAQDISSGDLEPTEDVSDPCDEPAGFGCPCTENSDCLSLIHISEPTRPY